VSVVESSLKVDLRYKCPVLLFLRFLPLSLSIITWLVYLAIWYQARQAILGYCFKLYTRTGANTAHVCKLLALFHLISQYLQIIISYILSIILSYRVKQAIYPPLSEISCKEATIWSQLVIQNSLRYISEYICKL
jgi:hypothetical protein